MRPPEIRITPTKNVTLGFSEIWSYRELLYFFTWRDIKVRYKNATLGFIWAVLQPLGLMLVFTIIFQTYWEDKIEKFNYPLFALAGLLIWGIFQSTITKTIESLSQQSQTIKKAYFPRIIIPGSALLVSLFDFFIGVIILILFIFFSSVRVSWIGLLLTPLSILPVCFFAIGLACFWGALTIKYRDFQYTIPFIIQILFFGSQIIYPSSLFDTGILKSVMILNPINTSIEMLRCSLGQSDINPIACITGTLSSFAWLIVGVLYFRKNEKYFADLL